MRTCKECGRKKSENDFTIACKRGSKVYYCSYCRECDNERRTKRYYKNHSHELEFRREYYRNNKDKWKGHNDLTENEKARKIELQRERRARDRRKSKAYKAIAKAIKNGELVPSSKCQKCGNGKNKIVAHHPDYNKPLFVEWLCEACHMSLHGLERRIIPQDI